MSMRVVLAAAESVPYAKTGGLADVIGGLAPALAAIGCDTSIVLPAHGIIDRAAFGFERLANVRLEVPVGSRSETASVLQGRLPGASAVRVFLLDHSGYFDRRGIYADPSTGGEYDDALERWIFFSRALLAALPVLGPPPDVLHLNDHHCALAAAYRAVGADVPAGFLQRSAVVFGIHNLAYQGVYGAESHGLTGLPAALMAPLGPLEFWGRINLMKSALVFADTLVTVSPTYAREIQSTPELGAGLEGVLHEREHELFGILNGIDTGAWDPARDPLLPRPYDSNHLEGKAECKSALQRRCGLAVAPRVPLLGMVSRLVEQKGIDLVLEALPQLLALPLQLVVLGRGEPAFEASLRAAAEQQPERLAVNIDYDDELARWIEAGSDFFLMPSRYEPCGLNQMYSMRYGSIPVVRRTGGLADTVQDWNGESGTGFVFAPYTSRALLDAVQRCMQAFQNAATMSSLVKACMRQDFSWARSALRYRQVYALSVAKRRGGAVGAASARIAAAPGREGH